jgi:alpha-glucoside transport system permease protein
VGIAAAVGVAFELWFLGGLAALIVAVIALPALAIAARGGLENRTYGRLTMVSVLVVLALVIASIPPASGLLGALRNSVLITVPSSVLLVVIAAGAAYAFAWTKFLGRDVLFLIVVGLLVVPLQIGLIPVANFYGATGLFGTIPGVVLFHVAFGLPFAVFLLRNFFIGIPHELLEAARMDGASEWRVFSRVVLPLGIPAIASLLIFQFLWVWNDLLVALVFAGSDARPLTVAIQQQLRTFGANIDVIAPGAYIQMIVPLIVFFAFQRYFVQGVLAGSVK